MHRLKQGHWSKKHGDCCSSCGTTERPHYARGLCHNCYQTEIIRPTEKRKQWEKDYRLKNKEKHTRYDKRYRADHPYRMWAFDTIGGHKRKGFTVTTTVDELEELARGTTRCPICKCELKWKQGKQSNSSPTLDRVNNGKVINKDTVWIICNRCNTTKLDRNWDEFLGYCELVVNKFGKKK